MGRAGGGVTVGTPGTPGELACRIDGAKISHFALIHFGNPLKSEVIGFFVEILEMWIQKLCSCD